LWGPQGGTPVGGPPGVQKAHGAGLPIDDEHLASRGAIDQAGAVRGPARRSQPAASLGGRIGDPDQALGTGLLRRTDHQVALQVVIGQPGSISGEGRPRAGADFPKTAGGVIKQDASIGLRGPAAGDDPAGGDLSLGSEGDGFPFCAGGIEVDDAEFGEAQGAEEGGEVLRRQVEAEGQDVGGPDGHEVVAVDEGGARGEGEAQLAEVLLRDQKDGRRWGRHPFTSAMPARCSSCSARSSMISSRYSKRGGNRWVGFAVMILEGSRLLRLEVPVLEILPAADPAACHHPVEDSEVKVDERHLRADQQELVDDEDAS